MKMSFWERLLRALELYCMMKQQEVGQLNVAKASFLGGPEEVDPDTGEVIEPDPVDYYLVKNSLNAREFPKSYEVSGGISMTIPEQTMSIRELMTRFAQGLPIDGEKVPVYNGEDDDMPDLKYMDLAERQEFIENAEIELADLKAKVERDKVRKGPQKPKNEGSKPDEDKPKEVNPELGLKDKQDLPIDPSE